jgi:putative two-component system response regulator
MGMTSDDLRLVPGARVLLAERDDAGAQHTAAHLKGVGHEVFLARDGEEALRVIRARDPEVALLDVGLRRLNAYQLCERIKSHPSTRAIPIILLVSPGAQDEKIRGLEVGAEDFLSHPVNKLELLARVKSLVKVKRLNEQVETTESVIFGLAQMLEQKMSQATGDSRRMADYACLLGASIGLGDDDLATLAKCAVLHDIGKIAVREEVLLKAGRLSAEEYNEIKIHPEIGERICGPLRDADRILPVIRHHQERWDGRGYPDGLRGEQIPLLARILAIADAYDAMLSPRPYRPALSPADAIANLRGGAGTQWDPYLVDVFLNAVRRREPVAA